MRILLADSELQESRPFALEGTELTSKLECKSRDLEDLGPAQSHFLAVGLILAFGNLWQASLANGRPHLRVQCALVKVRFAFCPL